MNWTTDPLPRPGDKEEDYVPAESVKSLAFLSYTRVDDYSGNLTKICELLTCEVQISTGEDFPIFQDHKDIAWGQNWKERIEDSIDASTFLIPILSPSFFKSQPCRDELTLFLERETSLGRGDLILPIYYVDTPVLKDGTEDELGRLLLTRQFVDWRKLRNKPLDSPEARESLSQLAMQIRDALERRSRSVAATGTSESSGIQEGKKPSRAAAGKEPPVRIVDAMRRGDFATISEAILAAKPGDRILVKPGLYSEGLVIDKPLEIVGDGDRAEVVVQATGKDAILFQATMGKVANLTLRQMGGGKWFGVDITQGRLDLEDCDINSQSLACVAIHGEADPHVRRNRIHDGAQGGVSFFENARGTLEENEIFGNALTGVAIFQGANPTVRRNRIYEGQQGGLFIYENSRGTVEDNDIFGNAMAAIEIKDGADPLVRRNRMYDGKGGGVFVWVNGKGTLEDNDIFGNTLAGIEIKDGGDPAVRRNRIHDAKAGGVFIWSGGKGTFEDNDIFGNAVAGVEIRDGGDPVLRRNRIRDGKQGGVFVHGECRGTLEDNDIFGNALAGMEIKEGGDPVVRRNRIHDGKAGGVFAQANGKGTLEDNDIYGNTLSGVEIREGADPVVRRNRIHDGKSCGVIVLSNGKGTLEENDIFGNAMAGMEIKDGGDPVARSNRVRDGKQSGVFVHGEGRGTLEENEVFGNAFVGVEIKEGGDPVLRSNQITKNGYQGVWIREGGRGTLENNDLRENKGGAWSIEAECEPNVKRSGNLE